MRNKKLDNFSFRPLGTCISDQNIIHIYIYIYNLLSAQVFAAFAIFNNT